MKKLSLLILLNVLMVFVPLAAMAASCTTSNATWTNTAFTSQTSTFTATYDDTPNGANMDGVTGLSLNTATDYTSLAVITRFNATGTIDARSGSAYAAVNSVPYTSGVVYRFRLVVNPSAHTYNAYVTPSGGSEIQIANNYAFRTEQAGTSRLNNLGIFSKVNTHTVCNFAIINAGDRTSPTISITVPTNATTVSGSAVTV